MANDSRRYLLGYGEELTSKISLSGGFGDKKHPYAFDEAKTRIRSRLQTTTSRLGELPAGATPNDEAVALLTLHPSYLAKSYFPEELLGAVGLRSIGSRGRKIKPEKVVQQRHKDKELQTVEIYAAGKRSHFERWARTVADWRDDEPGAAQVRTLEDVYAEEPTRRVNVSQQNKSKMYEALLHFDAANEDILEAFAAFVADHGGSASIDDSVRAKGLCYVPITLSDDAFKEVAAFSFLRTLRNMPQMRAPDPFRAATDPRFYIQLPTEAAVNPHIRVAILDGGLPAQPDLSAWVRHQDAPGVADADPRANAHGLGVTSAALFGPISENAPLPRPLVSVDHYRVVGDNDKAPHFYTILNRIKDVLTSEHYDFVNISLGPTENLDVNNLHPWTAVLDPILSHGKTLAFFAVGNDGHKPPPEGPRLSSPADAVNGLGIGACDTCGNTWARSRYSSIGPGRSPGTIKPDVVTFGGSPNEKFGMLASGLPLSATFDYGTSYAAPYAMRTALGVATYFGHALRTLAVKALLVHNALRGTRSINEVGWGRIPTDYEDLVVCGADEAHIVYQGVLAPAKALRVPVPLPAKLGTGPVTIKATICIATDVEPHHPTNYTNAGLEVFFRPHEDKRKKASQRHADTATFFQSHDLKATEAELRDDAKKWETTRTRQRDFEVSDLKKPAFDVRYVARAESTNADQPKDIPYAIVITVRQKGMAQFYDGIVNQYRTQLRALQPRVQVPIRL